MFFTVPWGMKTPMWLVQNDSPKVSRDPNEYFSTTQITMAFYMQASAKLLFLTECDCSVLNLSTTGQ